MIWLCVKAWIKIYQDKYGLKTFAKPFQILNYGTVYLFTQRDQASTERQHDFMHKSMKVTLYKNLEKI